MKMGFGIVKIKKNTGFRKIFNGGGRSSTQIIFQYKHAFRAYITDQWRRAPHPQEFPINK